MSADDRAPWTDAAATHANPVGDTATNGGNITDALLPQTLGGVFDEAFDLYKRHFATLALIVAVAYLPTQLALHGLVETWLRPILVRTEWTQGAPADLGAVFTAFFGCFLTGIPQAGIPGLFSVAALILVSGPITVAISDIYLGRQTSLRSAYRGVQRYFLRLLGGWSLVALAFIGIALISFFSLAMILGLLATALSGIGLPDAVGMIFFLLMLLVPYLIACAFVAHSYIFLTPLVVLEGSTVSSTPSRNAQLVGKKRFRRTWAAVFFLPIVVFGLELLILSSFQSVLETAHLPESLQFLAEMAAATAISFFLLPYLIIFPTLLYYDYRVRREGFDVRLLFSSLPTSAPASPDAGRSAE
jgi:hypothetical protein